MNKHLAAALVLSAVISACLLTPAQAADIPVVAASATGTYFKSPALVHDGIYAAEGSSWTGPQTLHWNDQVNATGVAITLDFGQVYALDQVQASVDNNDAYAVQTSIDGLAWTPLFSIAANDGEIGFGMDTMSSTPGSAEYVANTAFAAGVDARYARIFATGGDGLYAVSELAFTAAAPVPEPESIALLLAGLSLMSWHLRRNFPKDSA